MKLKEAMAQALIEGWEEERKMIDVVMRAAMLADLDLPIKLTKDDLMPFCKVLRVKYLRFAYPVRAFIEDHYSALSNAMWDGRSSDTQRAIALHALRAYNVKGAGLAQHFVSVRERDKGTDWNTTK